MPRNISGNYTLPLAPVVSGTVIESVWANTTLNDIAGALTNSLDRYGNGGMVAPFRQVDGTVTSPALSFTSETNSGLYRQSSGVVAMSILGNDKMTWSTVGTTVTGNLAVTGTTTFTGVPTFSGGAIVNGGDLTLADTYSLEWGDGSTAIAGNSATDVMVFGTNSLERARFTAAGEFLVGTTTVTLGAAGRGLIEVNGSTEGAISLDVGAASKGFFQASASLVRLGATVGIPLSLETGATERMRIDTSGNVGIGMVPAGSYKLEVAGNLRAANGASTGVQLLSGPPEIVQWYQSGFAEWRLYNPASSSDLRLYNGTLADMMWFTYAGNVGIGASPVAGYKLDVTGTIRSIGGEASYGLRVINSTQNGAGHFSPNAGVSGGVTLGGDAGPIVLVAAGAERARLNGSGLGIGKTPAYPLEVVGLGRFQYPSNAASGITVSPDFLGASGAGGIQIFQSGVIDWRFYNPASSADLRWNQGGADLMWLNSTGLGVGVSPTCKLDVYGNYIAMRSGTFAGYWGMGTLAAGQANTEMCLRSDSSLIFATGSGNPLRCQITSTGLSYFTADSSTTSPYASVVAANDVRAGSTLSFNYLAMRNGVSTGGTASTNTNAAFQTSSDARLKQNIIPLEDVGSIIDGIKVRRFEYIADPGVGHIGFVAQELYEQVPQVVYTGNDEQNIPWMIDYSRLTPILLREIQSLRARVAALGG